MSGQLLEAAELLGDAAHHGVEIHGIGLVTTLLSSLAWGIHCSCVRRVSESGQVTDWSAVGAIGASAGVGLGFGRVFLGLTRRPRLTLEEDTDRVQSRVEADGWPYVRILARNGRFSRGAKGARVIVESYRQPGQALTERITLGSPSLGWTSGDLETSADGSLTIPPGVARPLDLGYLTTVQRVAPSMANQWGLQLGLHKIRIADGRDRIPYGRWIIRLIATADDAATQTYDVTIEWNPSSPSPEAELATVVMNMTKV
jgi:hypothetical protein